MNVRDTESVRVEPLLVSQAEARRILGVGNTKFHDLKRQNVFEIVRLDRRDMITFRSLKQLAHPRPV